MRALKVIALLGGSRLICIAVSGLISFILIAATERRGGDYR